MNKNLETAIDDAKFNPTNGIPLTSYGPKSSPTYENVTWFSTVQPPVAVDDGSDAADAEE